MLGWMLNRGGRASEAPDDTLVDQPDTPAPVFAARALKSALFGTPAPATRSEKPKKQPQQQQSANAPALGTPAKQRPQSILLTPGVGTARRKRVSFGNDVAPADGKNGSKSGLPDDCPGKFPSPWVAPAQADDGEDSTAARRPRTSLTEKLENSRKFKPQPRQQDADGDRTKPSQAASIFTSTKDTAEERASDLAEAIWEDNDDQPEASDRERDVTVDLNEPCSGSGRFWKGEYTRYHDEARAEMEKLVRYKNLAKSYAKIKDGEALELNKRLHEEQAKVAAMETQVAELTRRIAKSHMNGAGGGADDGGDQAEILRDLTRQATLATQYRTQVKELEAIIKEGQAAAAAGSPEPETPRRRNGSRVVSPRSNQALIESQRQLKRAREQVRELEGLKSDLRAVERRVDEMQSAKERAEAELDESKAKAKDAAAKLAVVEDRARRKTEALEQLQEDHSKLREESRKVAREAKAELRAKNEEIARLKKALESNKTDSIPVAQEPSEQSDDVLTPYTPGPADVDWTVNVTQMELEQGTPIRMVGRRHKTTEVSQPATPLREEPRTRRQARAAVEVTYDEPPKAPADDAPIDLDDSTPRPSRRGPKLEDRPTERHHRASRRVATNDEDVGKEDWTRLLDQIKPNLDTTQPPERHQRASRRTTTRSDAPEEVKPTATRHFRRSSAAASDDDALGGGESSLRERLRSHSRTAQRFFTGAATGTTTRSRRRRDSATGLSEREEQAEGAVAHGDDDDLFKPKPVRHSVDAGVPAGSTPRAHLTTRRTSTSRPVSSVEPSSRPADAELDRRTTRTAPAATNGPVTVPSRRSVDEEEPQIDLLSDRFARLGGAVTKPAPRAEAAADTSMAATVGNTTRGTTLPPDRHAAAMARLQKRREERRRALDKENIRP
ncbi:hypothetical protein RB597_003106 [Gaeumannomyces tritici]